MAVPCYIITKQSNDSSKHGILAQLGEHLPYKQRVTGSSPVGPTSREIGVIKYGEIAQLARAHGSYPWCRGFKSLSRYFKSAFKMHFFCFIRNFSLPIFGIYNIKIGRP